MESGTIDKASWMNYWNNENKEHWGEKWVHEGVHI